MPIPKRRALCRPWRHQGFLSRSNLRRRGEGSGAWTPRRFTGLFQPRGSPLGRSRYGESRDTRQHWRSRTGERRDDDCRSTCGRPGTSSVLAGLLAGGRSHPQGLSVDDRSANSGLPGHFAWDHPQLDERRVHSVQPPRPGGPIPPGYHRQMAGWRQRRHSSQGLTPGPRATSRRPHSALQPRRGGAPLASRMISIPPTLIEDNAMHLSIHADTVPLLTPQQIEQVLIHALRLPEVFALARPHLTVKAFDEASESYLRLTWDAAVNVANQCGPEALFGDPAAARALMEVEVKVLAKPPKYTDSCLDSVLATVDPGVKDWSAEPGLGLLQRIYTKPEAELSPEYGTDLLRRFLVERAVARPVVERLTKGSTHGLPTDLSAILRQAAEREELYRHLGE